MHTDAQDFGILVKHPDNTPGENNVENSQDGHDGKPNAYGNPGGSRGPFGFMRAEILPHQRGHGAGQPERRHHDHHLEPHADHIGRDRVRAVHRHETGQHHSGDVSQDALDGSENPYAYDPSQKWEIYPCAGDLEMYDPVPSQEDPQKQGRSEPPGDHGGQGGTRYSQTGKRSPSEDQQGIQPDVEHRGEGQDF